MLEITRHIIDNPTGGTFDLFEETLPTTGYWVGGEGHSLVFADVLHLSPVMLNGFVNALPGRFVGWWIDEQTGKLWVDQCTWVPSLEAAHRIARSRGEIAFWDIANDHEIRTAR